MPRNFFPFLLAFLLTGTALLAQKVTTSFDITPASAQKISNSLYNKIICVDSRHDTANMGIVRIGALNRKAFLVPGKPFSQQINDILSAVTDEKAKDGTLLLQLRKFYFTEATDRRIQEGHCYFKAELYALKNNQYQKISTIDTVINASSISVKKEIIEKGGQAITNFIACNLLKEGNGRAYSFNDVVHIDSVEKRDIKVYNDTNYVDGAYYTFTSFKKQVPDEHVHVAMKGNKIAYIRGLDEDGDSIKVKPRNIYAVVDGGKPYIATRFGFYPLTKTNGDFFFTGRVESGNDPSDAIIAGAILGGIVGGIIAGAIAAPSTDVYYVQIDHITGNFIRINEVEPIDRTAVDYNKNRVEAVDNYQ